MDFKIIESRIMDFNSFNLNEKRERELSVSDSSSDIVEFDISQIVSGKMKPLEATPNNRKDKTTLSFPEIEDRESGERHEEVMLDLPHGDVLYVNFTWSYDFKPGMKGAGHDDPDDPDEYVLSYLNIDSVYFNEADVKITTKIKEMLTKYLKEHLPVD
jgi:hypothetical protein